MDHSAFARLLGEALILVASKATLDSQSDRTRLSSSTPSGGLTFDGEPIRGVATPSWLTPEQAAALLGVTPRWISRRWRRLDFCHGLPQGRGYRINAQELEAAMRRRG